MSVRTKIESPFDRTLRHSFAAFTTEQKEFHRKGRYNENRVHDRYFRLDFRIEITCRKTELCDSRFVQRFLGIKVSYIVYSRVIIYYRIAFSTAHVFRKENNVIISI